MKEYIEREEAVRAAKDGADEWDGGCSRYRDASIESAMNAIPAADVVEVVRCKDCKWWRGTIYGNLCSYHSGPMHTEFYDAEEFCSRGRKKMDGGVNDAAD